MPLADRHPFLQREVYVLLAPCLLAHSQYPPDFTTWEEQYEVDQEAFARWGLGAQGGMSLPAWLS